MKRWLAVAAVIVAADQATKWLVVQNLALHQAIEITPFFNLVLVYNPGAAFSFLAGASGWQREFFIGIALIASAWVLWLLWKHPGDTLFCAALALILGGAVGNVIDRIHIGAVTDFVQLHAYGYYWPAFNVADSAITCGALALVWDSFRARPAGSDVSA